MKTKMLSLMLLGIGVAGCGPVETEATFETGADLATAEQDLRFANPCALMKCSAGNHCEATGQTAACVPDTNPCWMMKCWAGTHCEPQKGGGASCVPDVNPCAMVKCWSGTHCEATSGGGASCVADTNPCMTVKCGLGTTCTVVNGQATCS